MKEITRISRESIPEPPEWFKDLPYSELLIRSYYFRIENGYIKMDHPVFSLKNNDPFVDVIRTPSAPLLPSVDTLCAFYDSSRKFRESVCKEANKVMLQRLLKSTDASTEVV